MSTMDPLARRVALRFSTDGQQSRYTAKELLSKTLDVLGQVESLEEYAFEADDALAGSDHKKAAEFNELKHIFREAEPPLEKAVQLLQRIWRSSKGEKLATEHIAAGEVNVQKLDRLVESIEKEVKQMRTSLDLYTKDPGKYKPQLDNLANAASTVGSTVGVIHRLIDKDA